MFRAGLLMVIGGVAAFLWARDIAMLGALLGGIVAGLLLGVVGLRHTKFETTDKGRFYTPHTYIGLFVTSLFLIRILARYLSIHTSSYDAPGPSQNPAAAYQNSWTLAVLGVLIGYYVAFNIGVLRKSRAQSPSTAQETSAI